MFESILKEGDVLIKSVQKEGFVTAFKNDMVFVNIFPGLEE